MKLPKTKRGRVMLVMFGTWSIGKWFLIGAGITFSDTLQYIIFYVLVATTTVMILKFFRSNAFQRRCSEMFVPFIRPSKITIPPDKGIPVPYVMKPILLRPKSAHPPGRVPK